MISQGCKLNAARENFEHQFAVQGEVNSRKLTVNIIDKEGTKSYISNAESVDRPVDLTDATAAYLYVLKNDGTESFSNGTISDAINGTIEFVLPAQATSVAGKIDCQILIIFKDNSKLKLVGLTLEVAPSNLENAVESTNEFSALVVALNKVNPAVERIDKAVSDSETALKNANEAKTISDTVTKRANTSADNADKAATNANEKATLADTKAKLADEKANLANSAANNANQKATIAGTAANLANEKAGLANAAATNANNKANLADTAANSANGATDKASKAADNADKKASAAQTATTNANTATNKANEATTKANTAADNANSKANLADKATANTKVETEKCATATNNANTATANANTATGKLNEALTNTNKAKDNANSAATNANNKANLANTATQNANTAKDDCIAATNNANTAITAANTATGKANTAADRANTAAETAESAIAGKLDPAIDKRIAAKADVDGGVASYKSLLSHASNSTHINQAEREKWNGKAEKSVIVPYSLLASKWVGEKSPYNYKIEHEKITATSNQELLPSETITVDELSALQSANLTDAGQDNGYLVLQVNGEKPKIDIPIRIIFRGDM